MGKLGSSEWYYYDRTSNRVYFNRPDLWAKMYICYSIKIKCEDLEAKIASGNYEIVNQVIKHERNGTETDKKDSASLIIKNQTPTDLITKTYQSAALPGYISYTLILTHRARPFPAAIPSTSKTFSKPLAIMTATGTAAKRQMAKIWSMS